MTDTRPEVTGRKLHTTSTSTPKKIRQRHERRHIELPGGKTLIPRAEFAAILGEDERTTRRRNLPTTYITHVAYVDRDGSLEIVAAGVKRPNQPQSTSSRHVSKRKATRPQRRALS